MLKRNSLSIVLASGLLCVSSMALDLPSNKIVDTKWLEANKADKSLVIIDIRESKKAYAKSHIPGAIHWIPKDFREKRNKEVPGYLPSPSKFTKLMEKSGITKDSNIVFYADGKKKNSYTVAGLGVFITEYYGFKNTAVLNGGFAAWEASKLAVNNEKVKGTKSDWKITSMDISNLANSSNIDKAVILGDTQVVDARKKVHYTGEKKHKKAKKAGHIESAKSLPATKFTKGDAGIYYIVGKDAAQAAMKKANIDMSKPLIWYCNSGWNASGAWFVGKYVAGLKDAKVYDGSMFEYSRLPNRKVEKAK